MKSKKIISLLLTITSMLISLCGTNLTTKAEQKESYIENICVTDDILVNADKITLNGTNYSDQTLLSEVCNHSNTGNRDSFILHNYFINGNVDEEKSIMIENQERILNAKFSDTDMEINHVKFLNANLGALKNIQITGEDIASDNIILYSESGDITINNHTNINFRGLIYAPNGTVTIHANNLNIDGTVVAKSINLDAEVININNQSTLSDYIMEQPELQNTKIGDYSFEYDSFGTTQQINHEGDVYAQYSYTNNLAHQLNEIRYINGDSVQYYYNENGQLTGIGSNNDSNLDMEYRYDEENQLVEKIDYKNNLKTFYFDKKLCVYKMKNGQDIFWYEQSKDGYDNLVEAIQPDVTVNGTDLLYKYDLNHNKVQEEYKLKNSGDIFEVQEGGKSIFYTYDAERQLTRVDNVNLGISYLYSYDAIGNLVKKETYEYTKGNLTKLLNCNNIYFDDNKPDRMIQFNSNTFLYDSMGNPTKYFDWSMQWTKGRQLVELKDSQNSIQYHYDDVNRVSKTVNGVETDFRYTNSKVSYQSDGTDTLEFQIDTKYNYTGFLLNKKVYIYVKNLLGDIVAIENEEGTVVCTYQYDAWGNVIQITGDMRIGQLNPIRYRSYYFDSETGFYYLGSRYYNPETCRFLNADEYCLCIDNNKNMYQYCENNPMYYIDDSGYYAMQNSNIIQYVEDTVYSYINSGGNNIPTDDKYLIATVAGEAIGQNTTARRAVASVIVNRTVTRYSSNGNYYSTVSWPYQYTSYLTNEYNKCMNYLNSRNGSSTLYEPLIETCLKVGYRIVSDITSGCVLFYSPQLVSGQPNWDFTILQEVFISGVSTSTFRFYKLK
ncbi:RHS repeat-associated core domain-containing protein [Anaeromicropila populeti]|uniref:RHS repeat-associated core domain-containing protein n=1 Tax=Anaeromicropila populeti TaxID=37658 RepID=UPI0015A6FE27|nr:RHS repeat-associated core domain-containing protein [Anaeromicropila populeti]